MLVTAALAGLLAVFSAVPGSATPPSNLTSVGLARGTDQSDGTIPFKEGTDVVMAQNTFGPGGSSGWHSHPGGAVVVVQQGELTLYRSVGGHCEATLYIKGQSFIERPSDIQNAVNTGAVNTITFVVFPGVPKGGASRIDQPDPGTCPGV